MLLGIGLIGRGFANGVDESNRRGVVVLFGIGCFLGGLYAFQYARRMRVVVFPDALEVHRVFGVIRITREEIAGYRIGPRVYGARSIEFYRNPKSAWELRLVNVDTDEAFEEWLQTFPNLGK